MRGLNEGTRIHILLMYKHEGLEQRGAEWPRKVQPHLLQVDGARICLEKGLFFFFFVTMIDSDKVTLMK